MHALRTEKPVSCNPMCGTHRDDCGRFLRLNASLDGEGGGGLASLHTKSVLALATVKKTSRPPSLPGNVGVFLLRWTLEAKGTHACGSGTTQTQPSPAGVSAVAQLDRSPRRLPARVCRAVSLPSGNPPFVLRQCPPQFVLLSRVWPRRRSHSLC